MSPAGVAEPWGSATRAPGTNVPGRCPSCGRRLREHAEQLAVAYMRRADHLGLLAVRDVAEGAGLPLRLAERVLRHPGGPFERVVRHPGPGRPWLYRLRPGWRS